VIYTLACEAESRFQSCILSNITVSSLTSPFVDEERYSIKLARSYTEETEKAQGQSEKLIKKLDRFTIGVRPFKNIPQDPYAPIASYDTLADFRDMDVDWHKALLIRAEAPWPTAPVTFSFTTQGSTNISDWLR